MDLQGFGESKGRCCENQSENVASIRRYTSPTEERMRVISEVKVGRSLNSK